MVENKLRLGYPVISWNSPLVTTWKYMKKLMDLVTDLGAKFVKYDLNSNNIKEFLLSFYPKIDITINCLGLGSKLVFNDPEVLPIRGVMVTLKPQPHIMNQVFAFENPPCDPIYVISREDVCLLGGTTHYNDYNTTTTEEEVKKIIENCVKLVPELESRGSVMDHVTGAWVGLRPGRNVIRLELDTLYFPEVPIVHCYGHGGSGWTTHWGCAQDVVEIVNNQLSDSKKSKL